MAAANILIGAALAGGFRSTVGRAQKDLEKLGEAVDGARLGKAITGDVARLENELRRLEARQEKVGGGSQRLSRRIRDVKERLAAANREAKKHGIEVGNAARQHRIFSDRLRKSQRELRKTESALGSAGGGLFGGPAEAAAAIYAGARIVGGAMNLDTQAIHLRTVVTAEDGDAEAAVLRARQRARAFARDTLADEGEILGIHYELSSAGLAEAAATAGAEVVHKVAKVARGDATGVGTVIGTVFNTLGAQMSGGVEDKLARIGDVLTQTQLKFQISDFGQLGEGIAEAAGNASSARVPFEQTAVAIGMLNTAGIRGSTSGTAYSAVLRQLPTATRKLGVEMVRGADGALDLEATLAGVQRALAGLSIDERSVRLQELFGDEGKRGLIPLLDNLEGYRQGLADAADAGGTVSENYELFLESSRGLWDSMKQNLGQVGAVLGTTLFPALGLVFGAVGRLAGGAAELAERFPLAAKVVGALAVALAVTLAGAAIPTVIGALGALKVAIFANPITAVIGLLVGGAVLLVQHWDAVKGFFGSVWDAIAGGARRAFSWVKEHAGWLAVLTGPVGLMVGAATLLVRNWDAVVGFFGRLWDGVKVGLGAVVGALKGAFTGAWEWVSNFSLFDAGKKLLGTLAAGVRNAGGAVVGAVGDALGKVRDLLPFSDARTGPLSALTASGGSIVATVGEGVRRAGGAPLRAPLQAALAEGVAGLSLPVPANRASAAAPAGGATIHVHLAPGSVTVQVPEGSATPERIREEVDRSLAASLRRAVIEAGLTQLDLSSGALR